MLSIFYPLLLLIVFIELAKGQDSKHTCVGNPNGKNLAYPYALQADNQHTIWSSSQINFDATTTTTNCGTIPGTLVSLFNDITKPQTTRNTIRVGIQTGVGMVNLYFWLNHGESCRWCLNVDPSQVKDISVTSSS